MRQLDVVLPTNRKFGLFFTAIFAVAAGYYRIDLLNTAGLVLGGLAVVTLALALSAPQLLLPFNKAWMGFGLLLGSIIRPIVLGIIFFVMITPMALGMKLFGRDELRLKMNQRATHWKTRQPAGPEGSSFRNQY